jgi:hypothetical protein
MKSLFYGYDREDQAPYILKCIRNYRIASKLGYFVIDNNTSNNKILWAVSCCKSVFFSWNFWCNLLIKI